HRAADAAPLEPGRLDQTRRVIAWRILEHRAAAPLPERLGVAPPCQQLQRLARLRRARLELELRGDEPFVDARRRVGRLQRDAAVADRKVRGAARAALP